MFEQTFKNIDDILRKDSGCSSELDYVEQTSWILFLKYLDDFEKQKKTEAELASEKYTPLIEEKYKWENWAAPKDKNGKLDHNNAKIGDDLLKFVNQKLFAYMKGFKLKAESADIIEYKIGEIFGELKNKLQSGYNLREVINLVDELMFNGSKEKLYKLDESDYIKGYYRSKPAQNINNKERKKEIDKMLNNIHKKKK